QQETLRQYEALHAFEKRHGVTIPEANWFKDEGWARDTADRRPDFLRLMKQAETGRVQWIVVSERDRFGTTDADEVIHFRYPLRKWGCRLFAAPVRIGLARTLPPPSRPLSMARSQSRSSTPTRNGFWALKLRWRALGSGRAAPSGSGST